MYMSVSNISFPILNDLPWPIFNGVSNNNIKHLDSEPYEMRRYDDTYYIMNRDIIMGWRGRVK